MISGIGLSEIGAILTRSAREWSANGATLDTYTQYLTAYWNLNQTSGNRGDSAGSNTLTDNNTVGYIAGINGNAANFTAANSESLSLADTAAVSFTAGFAISFWFQVDTLASTRGLISKGALNGEYEVTSFNDASKLFFRAYQSGGTGVYIDGITISAATTYHCVVLGDDTEGKIFMYLNNVSQGTPAAWDGTVKDSTNTFYIGSRNGGDFHNSWIDEVAVFKGLTFADQATREAFVAALYNSGTGSFYQ